MKALIQSEIILFACVFNNLRKDIDPYPSQYIYNELMSLYPWTTEYINNRVTWYAIPYYAADSLYDESRPEKIQYLYRQFAHLIKKEQHTKTICIDPISLDTSKKICLPTEIISYLHMQIEKD